MMVDTHCHLTDEKLCGDIKGVLERARSAGVKRIIVPTTNLEDIRQAVGIVDRFKDVFMLVGVHPEHAEEAMDTEELVKTIGSSKKVVGVGEIGLDFHYDKEKKTKLKQVKLFKTQLKMAIEHKLPVAIHTREAEKETRRVLDGFKVSFNGVFHCWSGDKKFLKYVLDKGFHVSFCGNVTYKNNESLRDLLKLVPLDKLLLETDSPYLSPEPLRGRLNEPKNVKILASFIADILKVDVDTLVNQTTKNSICLFSLEN
jgi:TatD DNase family protein